ncbi:DUF885 domain-containing protein [Pseudoalteromonas luteoviolacea]|uniref:Lipoprotein n=1 Tax=Pseudoalteromonas luteoviolacea NCIMB 1942 TaxID=1365253 RepID=A0A162ABC4_9GAMM|nr:DUF885 domain-containing protein [Pseudoalteromonas luteoviolacea]KZN47013.1 hypothetical protein N482_02010 [Pseudoalteromonas luteoviolacea NCIMB 1942]KZW99401.1 hypothetical protein JL49_17465 [Pseudoalteromonas luteoviolacea]
MYRSLVALSVVAVLTGCQANNSQNQTNSNATQTVAATMSSVEKETKRVNEWFAEKYEQQLQMSPMRMTIYGRKDRYSEIDDVTIQGARRDLAWLAGTVAELRAQFDYTKLDAEAQISYDLWIYQYEQQKKDLDFVNNSYIFTHMFGIQSWATQFMMNFHKVDTQQDMEDYNKRLIAISHALNELLAQTKNKASLGIRTPKFSYQGIIKQSKAMIIGAPFSESEKDAPLWADAKKKINSLVEKEVISQTVADNLLEETKQALTTEYKNSYEQLVSWFEKDIQNLKQEDGFGVSDQPNGQAFYNYRLANQTSTDLTADEIHQIGISEVVRIKGEMLKVVEQVGFEGDLQAFFEFFRTDAQFFYENNDKGRQGYIDDSIAYLDKINEKLPEYFGILPKSELLVKRVEPFRERPGAAQHYMPGTKDGSRPGVYYAHLIDMTSMPKNNMEAIAYHEGNPGHHMQLSIAQELAGIPEFRTKAMFTAYSEGWGLYAELLAKEMGGYEDSYSDFGRLVNEMWRAVRLVVDTGIHSKGWSEEQAVAYFKENTPIQETSIRSEVHRYMINPGQATSYKIGMNKILEMRKRAKKELGSKFDIRGFHDTILGGGAMPLSILEKRVNHWIEAQKRI